MGSRPPIWDFISTYVSFILYYHSINPQTQRTKNAHAGNSAQHSTTPRPFTLQTQRPPQTPSSNTSNHETLPPISDSHRTPHHAQSHPTYYLSPIPAKTLPPFRPVVALYPASKRSAQPVAYTPLYFSPSVFFRSRIPEPSSLLRGG